jgi:hypothetical protein
MMMILKKWIIEVVVHSIYDAVNFGLSLNRTEKTSSKCG